MNDIDHARADWKRARRPAERSERLATIVDATIALLDGGTAAETISMAAVATEAGLSPSSLYTYFDNREALLLRAMTAQTADWLRDLVARIEQVGAAEATDGDKEGDGGGDKDDRFAVAVAESLRGRRPLLELMTRAASLMAAAGPDERAAMKETLDQPLALVGTAIEAHHESLDGDQVLRLLRATIVGLTTFTSANPLTATAEEQQWFHDELRLAVRAILRGLRAD